MPSSSSLTTFNETTALHWNARMLECPGEDKMTSSLENGLAT